MVEILLALFVALNVMTAKILVPVVLTALLFATGVISMSLLNIEKNNSLAPLCYVLVVLWSLGIVTGMTFLMKHF